MTLTSHHAIRPNPFLRLPGEVAMAPTVAVALVDDLDGSPADETVQFGFGGAAYEIK